MTEYNIIKTKIFRRQEGFVQQRSVRIAEAIGFEGGTIEKPTKILISILPNGKESCFFKPGKEIRRAKPNIYDMSPDVGKNNRSEVEGYTFEIIWKYLVEISVINKLTFKKVLVLLYRLCYFLDHDEVETGKLRYSPSKEISDYIDKINFLLKEGFKDKFKRDGIGLLEFLHLMDLVSWNEDVKYHIKNTKPDFEDKNREDVGRVNTILTTISIPLMISGFLSNIIENINHTEKIDVSLILCAMQRLSRSRGMCVLTNKELIGYLSPYLEK